MNTFSDNLLSVVDRFCGQLGPLAFFIDSIVERIAPTTTTQAIATCNGAGPGTSRPYYCGHYCHPDCCARCSGDYFQPIFDAWAADYHCTNGIGCYRECSYC